MIARRYPHGPSMFAALRGIGGTELSRVPAFLTGVAERYGAVASWRMPNRRWYFLNDAGLIEGLLTASGYDVIKGRGLRRMRRLLGLGLLTSDEPLHLRQRRLVQPAFHRERIAGYAATMIALSRAAAESVRDGEVVAVDAFMNRLALRIAAATLFSADVQDDADTIGSAVSEVMAVFPASLSAFGELLDHVPFHPVTRRFKAARAQLDGVIFRLIADRRRDRVDRGDLLSMLLTSVDEEGGRMSDELVRDEALTLLLAGHETTANALAWAWDFLARDAASEARLHAELDEVLPDGDPRLEDVARLRFTHDVIAETMRLRPPAWVVGRRVIRPFRLGEWELAPGSVVLASQLVTHRNRWYWDEPDAFRPERWSNGEIERVPKYAYFPFGGGNRMCIGEGFAWAEAVLALATLARRLRFEQLDPAPVPVRPLVTLRPARPMAMRARERRSPISV